MLSAHCFIDLVNLIRMLGAMPPLFLLILSRMRREELPYEKIMDFWLGKIKSKARFFISEESFDKMGCDLETYVATLALLATGRLKVRRTKKSRKSLFLNFYQNLHKKDS